MKRKIILACLVSALLAVMVFGCSDQNSPNPSAVTTAEEDAPALAKGNGSGQVNADVSLEASFKAKTTVSGCSNSPGPYITLEGELGLGGVNARLIFRNNAKGTHEHIEDVTVDVVIIPAGETIKFNKQPPLDGAGGNPWILLKLGDGKGHYYTEEILLGRCVQGLFNTKVLFGLLSKALAKVTTADCSNSPGPYITLDGELVIGGVEATLIFRNNKKGTHEHVEDVEVSIVILPAGESIKFPKQPPLDGAGGNPHILLQFVSPSGKELSPEFYLGRCVQLSK